MDNFGMIDNTPLWEDIISVIKVNDRNRNAKVSATFHTEKEDFPALKVLMMENKRDYYGSTGEYSAIAVYLPVGDYVYRLLPFRDHLEINVKMIFMTEGGEESLEDSPTEFLYKALIDFKTNSFPSSESISNRTLRELNNLPPITVNLELQDRCEEPLRLKMIDGVYRNVTMEQMLRGTFIHEANKIKVDGKPIIQVLELDKPDNTEPVANLLIPQGVFLRDLPGYLQEKSRGVYNAGIGSFFQRYMRKPSWFVYPLYKKTRFDEDRTKLVIYAVPEDRMPAINNTYRSEGKIIYIAATGEKKMAENSRNPDLNKGTGFRMADAEAFMLKPVKILEEGIQAVRRSLNHEVASQSRKDQMNSGQIHSSSSNAFMKYSELQSRDFSGVSVLWSNSNPDLLYPGMPVKYVYMDRGEYVEAKGTLVTAYTIIKLLGNPLEGTGHSISTQLHLFIEPQSTLPNNVAATRIGETL